MHQMSASTRRIVSMIAGCRDSHGPNRHHRFQVAMRKRSSAIRATLSK
jgi:hypothetical protein